MSEVMKSIKIANKWENFITLIIAKKEHKEKFYNRIDYGDDGIMVRDAGLYSIPYHIQEIKYQRDRFMYCLSCIIEQKYQKYITERKISIPNLNGITEYNCETDCPVCMETIGDNTNGCMEGDNCNHTICSNCRDIIVSNTNKCPICRAKLDDNITDEEQNDNESEYSRTENSDDESDWGDDDDNLRPTTENDNLYPGRRWFNTETNIMEYWTGTEWTTTLIRPRMSNFIIRNYGYDNTLEHRTCCLSCGLQRTREVNNAMDFDDPRLRGNFFHYGECYDCHIIITRMEDHFNTMDYPH
jgi:hypothetical protein